MDETFLVRITRYVTEVEVGFTNAFQQDRGLSVALVALGWFLFPWLLQTLLHPGDLILLQFRWLGGHPPRHVSLQQKGIAEIETIITLMMLVVLQMVGTVLFYRRAHISNMPLVTPSLWPLAALSVGVIGNGIWWLLTGVFDPAGCVIGLVSAGLAVLAEIIVAGLGRDFVLGAARANQHPPLRQPVTPQVDPQHPYQ